ncbi:HAD-IA family hydrolase [Candidatus Woesearchaeota archaeon]|nr:HAD-IA family hydrolase [Candidatus Woesearchaeota archaeon]
MPSLHNFCFDIGGVACTQDSTHRAVIKGKKYWGEDFSSQELKKLLYADLGDGQDYWREFQNGKLSKEDYLEKSLLAGKFSVSIVNKLRLEDCLKAWCGDPYQPILDLISRLKDEGYSTGVLTNNNEIMYNTPSGRVQYLVDVAVSSHEIGVSKPDEEAYLTLLDRMGARAEETFFVDDKLVNILAAQCLGICGFHFRSREIGMDGAFEELRKFLNGKKVFG